MNLHGDGDSDLVVRWLANVRAPRSKQPQSVDDDADDDVLAILVDDSDPDRGWDLVMRMIQSARDEYELRQVGIQAMETLLRESGDKLADRFLEAVRSDNRVRNAASHIYLSGKVAELARAEGLYPR
jgi:hypothetical protein